MGSLSNSEQNQIYKTKFYQFSEYPQSDSCWSLSTGPDGRIYAAVCNELSSGGSVQVARYNENTDSIDYLFDVPEVVNDPVNSGRATQCKIHYSFVPSLEDGILYCATHLSAPPFDLEFYSPWRFWHNEKRCFRGSALIAYDTNKDIVLWVDTLIPKEGCRCLAFDDKRKILYALSYPRDHFIVYSLKDKTCRDIGRVGSINSQVIFLDSKGMVWFSNDYGHLIRYNPDRDILEESPYILPHEPYQTGWHSVLYDAVRSPDGRCIYMITWNVAPRLIRFWPDEREFGYAEDLGVITQKRNTAIPYSMFVDHAGGLVFDNDGQLYFVFSRWYDETEQLEPPGRQIKAEGVVLRLNPITLEREENGVLKRPAAIAQYITRGAKDRNGDIFFGNVGKIPVGFFKMQMPNRNRDAGSFLPLRMWG